MKQSFDALIEYLTKRMRMSHIYQPLMIRSLVESDGIATIRQLAHAFIIQDESQLKYYEDRIKNMPLKVLKKNGVVDREGELVSLKTGKLTFEQKPKSKCSAIRKCRSSSSNEDSAYGTTDYWTPRSVGAYTMR